MRSFVALELPASAQEAAGRVIDDLADCGAAVKWVRPGSLHLTLKFLGEVAEERVAELAGAVEAACAPFPALALTLAGCGAFPSLARPSVLWLGLKGDLGPLAELARRMQEGFGPLGFVPEARPFKPHVTLGRLRQGRGRGRGRGAPPAPAELTRALAGMAAYAGPDFTAGRVALMKSTLTPQGPRYEPLHVTLLRKD